MSSPASTPRTSRWPIGFTVGAAVSLLAYGSMLIVDGQTGTLRAGSTPVTIGLYLAAFASYLTVVRANEHHRLPVRWLWALPVVFRLLLLATEPTLSDDVYRYLWDGHVLSNGVSPYRYVVSAPELDGLDIPLRALVNNPDLASPYLPAAHALFALLALTLPASPLTMQAVMATFDVAVAVVLWRLLPLAGLPARRAMLYLWHPLVIVEAAHGAHFDSLMTFLAVVAVWAAFDPAGAEAPAGEPDRRPSWRRLIVGAVSPVALALAALTRPVPLLLLPVLWWRWSWWQRAVAAATMIAAPLPFGLGSAGWGLGDSADGTGVFGSARAYAAEFRFNAVVATWIETWTGGLGGQSSVALGGLMALVVGAVWLLARTCRSSHPSEVRRQLRLLTIPILGYVVLTPVLHPWYLTIAMAAIVVLAPAESEGARRWWLLAPWWYLSAAVSFSYLTYLDPDAFGELDWVRRLEWYPTLAGWALVAGVGIYAVLSGRSSIGPLARRRSKPEPRSVGKASGC